MLQCKSMSVIRCWQQCKGRRYSKEYVGKYLKEIHYTIGFIVFITNTFI